MTKDTTASPTNEDYARALRPVFETAFPDRFSNLDEQAWGEMTRRLAELGNLVDKIQARVAKKEARRKARGEARPAS